MSEKSSEERGEVGIMDPVIEALGKWGCDIDCIKTRFFDNESFYLQMLDLLKKDDNIEKLKTAVDAKDVRGVFESAHAIKGIMGNMGITPVYSRVCDLVELTREVPSGDPIPAGAFDLEREIIEQYDIFMGITSEAN